MHVNSGPTCLQAGVTGFQRAFIERSSYVPHAGKLFPPPDAPILPPRLSTIRTQLSSY